jgi:hypothetical protein
MKTPFLERNMFMKSGGVAFVKLHKKNCATVLGTVAHGNSGVN